MKIETQKIAESRSFDKPPICFSQRFFCLENLLGPLKHFFFELKTVKRQLGLTPAGTTSDHQDHEKDHAADARGFKV